MPIEDLPNHIKFARELRKNQTKEEKIIWDMLRNRKLLNFKFLRQHPIIVNRYNNTTEFYIADFYCAEKKFVPEIDGLIHLYQIEYDEARDFIMKEMGMEILRVTNKEVNEDVYGVLKRIKGALVNV